MFTRTFVLFSSIHNTSFRKNTTKPTPRQAPICHLSRVTPWGGVVVPPQGAAPEGGAAAPLPPPLGPHSLRSGGARGVGGPSLRSGPLRCARAGPVCAGCGPRCRPLLTPAPGGFPARGGSLRSPPGRLASPPCGRLRPSPRLGRARPSLGGRVPPRARRCGGSGGGGAPPVGGLLRRPRAAGARLGLRSGSGSLRSPSPPLRPPSRALAAPRAPPSGPAAARRLRAARLPSLLPPWGPPRGGGAQRSRALLAASPRGGLPPAWLRLFGAAVVVGLCACGRGVGGCAAGLKAPPSLPPPGASNVGLDPAAPHLRAFAMVGTPAPYRWSGKDKGSFSTLYSTKACCSIFRFCEKCTEKALPGARSTPRNASIIPPALHTSPCKADNSLHKSSLSPCLHGSKAAAPACNCPWSAPTAPRRISYAASEPPHSGAF